jgi:hypothetical protein
VFRLLRFGQFSAHEVFINFPQLAVQVVGGGYERLETRADRHNIPGPFKPTSQPRFGGVLFA